MEKENQNLWLIAVLLLSQNKKLMEDIRPVLTFLEEHEQSLSLLEKMFTAKAQEQTNSSPEAGSPLGSFDGTGKRESSHAREKAENEPTGNGSEKENSQSPFSGIANEEILKSIGAYFAANANRST